MKIFNVAIIISILFTVQSDSTDSSSQCNVRGQCKNGILGRLLTTPDQLECLKVCQTMDSFQCKWYTFRAHSSLNCELFESCESVIDDNTCNGCISGQVTCPSDFCDREGLCMGKLLSTEQQYYKYYCDLDCQEDPNCHFYSFESSGGSRDCYLFETCSTLDENVNNFLSSKAGCPNV